MAKITSDSPVWFITGCSTGFGREFVRLALAHGFRVVATARDPSQLDDLVAGYEGQAIALALDVTDANHIKHAVDKAERVFGRIDVLVNNAGYGYLSAVEEGEEPEIRAMFETNFFGRVGEGISLISHRLGGLSVFPAQAITPRPNSRWKDCRNLYRRKSNRWASMCWWSSRDRSVLIGRDVR